jgi:hypothetical protein
MLALAIGTVITFYLCIVLKLEPLLTPPSQPDMSSDCQGTEDDCNQSCSDGGSGSSYNQTQCLVNCDGDYQDCLSAWATFTNQTDYTNTRNSEIAADNNRISNILMQAVAGAVLGVISFTSLMICFLSSKHNKNAWFALLTAGIFPMLYLGYQTSQIVYTPYLRGRVEHLPQPDQTMLTALFINTDLATTNISVSRILTILILALICQQNPEQSERGENVSAQRQDRRFRLLVNAWHGMFAAGAASLQNSDEDVDDSIIEISSSHQATEMSALLAPPREEGVIAATLSNIRFFNTTRYSDRVALSSRDSIELSP